MREDDGGLKVAAMQLHRCQQPLKPKEGEEEEEEEEELAALASEAAEIVSAMGKAAAFITLSSIYLRAVL